MLIPNRLHTLRAYLNAAIGAAASVHELVIHLAGTPAVREDPRGLAYLQALEPRVFAFRSDLERSLVRLGTSKSTIREWAGIWIGRVTAWLERQRSEQETAMQLRDLYVGLSALYAQSRCVAVVARRLDDVQTARIFRDYADTFGSAMEELRSIIDEVLVGQLIEEGKAIPRASDSPRLVETRSGEPAELDFERAKLDPASSFESPRAVLTEPGLSREQRIDLLRRWEYDARELLVAEAENMGGGEPAPLQEIHRALDALGAHPQDGAPTQHGGG